MRASGFPVSRAERIADVSVLCFMYFFFEGAKEFLKCLRIMQFVQFPPSLAFFRFIFRPSFLS